MRRVVHVLAVGLSVYVRSRRQPAAKRAVLYREALETLGALFIKLGQHLSTRQDIVALVYRHELMKLQGQVATIPWSQIAPVFARNYDCAVTDYFDMFDTTVHAAASFAQTYRATKDGKDLLVKIKKSDVERRAAADLALLRLVAWMIDTATNRRYQLRAIITELASWTEAELDYYQEIENQGDLQAVSEQAIFSDVVIPHPYKDWSTKEVLVMDYIDGISLNVFVQQAASQTETAEAARAVLVNTVSAFLIESAHACGVFHADPHPSNILITTTGQVAFVDFGIVGRIDHVARTRLLQYLRTLVAGDITESYHMLISLCQLPEQVDQTVVLAEYEAICAVLRDPELTMGQYLAHQKEHGTVFLDIIFLFQKHRIKIPTDLLLYMKAFNTTEGVIAQVHPHFALQEILTVFQDISYYNGYRLMNHKKKQWLTQAHKPHAVITSVENALL